MQAYVLVERDAGGKITIPIAFENYEAALSHCNESRWDYVTEDMAFGEEVAERVRAKSDWGTPRDAHKFWRQLWKDYYDPEQHSKFWVKSILIF